MDRLPEDILYILSQWVRDICGLDAVSRLARSFKAISQQANEVLRLRVVLSNDSIALYNTHDHSGDATRSLTLRLEPGDLPPPGPFGHPRPAAGDLSERQLDKASERLSTALRELCPVLKDLQSLESFSLSVTARGRSAPKFALVRSDLASLVAALPATVNALEIDTRGVEDSDLEIAEADAICYAISNRLSQLKHLRLRTACFSTRLFSPEQDFGQLCSLRLNWCCRRGASVYDPSVDQQSSAIDAKGQLVTSYRKALARPGESSGSLQSARILEFFMKPSPDDPLDFSTYHMFRDVNLIPDEDLNSASITAYPVSNEWSHLGYWCARTRSHDHALGSRDTLQQLIEQPGWYTTAFGARCAPDPKVHAAGLLPVQLPILDREQWAVKMGRKKYNLWVNEDATGQKLLDVQDRENYEDLTPPKWTVPSGWIDEAGTFRVDHKISESQTA